MPSVSAIIPAHNEAANIALVVAGLLALRDRAGAALIHEVIVADNASTDDTATLAIAGGATVVPVPERGYGSACAGACRVAGGDILLFADGDHTADLAQAAWLLDAIAQGADLAIGVRTHAARGSLTLPQRLGNRLACFLVRLIWPVPITDLGPFRAIRRTAYDRIGMRDRAYGWTVEMQIRAAQLKLRTSEIAVSWLPRHAGASKVSGTVRGVAGAAWGILSMIARLWFRERTEARPPAPSAVFPPVEALPAGRTPLSSASPSRPFRIRSKS
jgi:glycosyltransferase involved in cell wall biosynthesis